MCVFDKASTVQGWHGRGLLGRALYEVGMANAAQHNNLESVTAPHPGGPRHLNCATRVPGIYMCARLLTAAPFVSIFMTAYTRDGTPSAAEIDVYYIFSAFYMCARLLTAAPSCLFS